jgi:hypothetical protein
MAFLFYVMVIGHETKVLIKTQGVATLSSKLDVKQIVLSILTWFFKVQVEIGVGP